MFLYLKHKIHRLRYFHFLNLVQHHRIKIYKEINIHIAEKLLVLEVFHYLELCTNVARVQFGIYIYLFDYLCNNLSLNFRCCILISFVPLLLLDLLRFRRIRLFFFDSHYELFHCLIRNFYVHFRMRCNYLRLKNIDLIL